MRIGILQDVSDSQIGRFAGLTIGEHSGVKILRTMRHEVESGHQQNHVDQEEPMSLQGNLSLSKEGTRKIALTLSQRLSFSECLCFRQTQSEDDD